MNCLVVGAGEMGRWLGATLRAEADADLAFADRDPAVAEAASDAVAGRPVPLDGDEHFDVVAVAVPIPVAREAIREAGGRATDAVVDVTGRMAEPVAAGREHAPDLERASLHPLFAADNAPGTVAVVREADGPAVGAVLDAVAAAGNDLAATTPAEHDRAMETVQAAAHAAVLAYGLAAEEVPAWAHTNVSAGLTDLVGTVTGNTPRVYADVQAAFEGADRVAAAAERIAAADREAFTDLYREAGEPFGNAGGDGGESDSANAAATDPRAAGANPSGGDGPGDRTGDGSGDRTDDGGDRR